MPQAGPFSSWPARIVRLHRDARHAARLACGLMVVDPESQEAIQKVEHEMTEKVRDAMTPSPVSIERSATVTEAARCMADHDIGAVLVEENSALVGLVTDRDIAVRAVARGRDPNATPVTEICTEMPITVSPDDELDEVVAIMREKAVRRVPVVDGQRAVGILSLGDLAQRRDSQSALGQISSAPPNQ
jgi:CBS domain-containing protein